MIDSEKLGKISYQLCAVIGRLTIMRDIPVIKEAHEILLKASSELDDVINEILEEESK